MSEIIGRDLEVGLAVEDTRGTAQSSAEKWLKRASVNIRERAEHVTDDNTVGSLEDSEGRKVVQKWLEGELEASVQADMVGYLLYNLYGSVTSSELSSGVYEHTFTLEDSIQHSSLSIFVKDGSIEQQVFDTGMVASLEINASTEELVRMTANFQAKEGTSNSDTPSYDTEYDFVGKDITVKVADTESGLSGADELNLKDITVSWDAGTILDFVLGQYTPKDIFNGAFALEGSFTKNYIDDTFKSLYQNDTSKYMRITIEGTEDLGGGNYPKIQITLNKVMVTDWDKSDDNDEPVTEEISFKAFRNSSDDEQSEVVIQNVTEEYDIAPTV